MSFSIIFTLIISTLNETNNENAVLYKHKRAMRPISTLNETNNENAVLNND